MRKLSRNDTIHYRILNPCEDDTCVLCGGRTGYKRSDPIHQRLYYIEGAGQLCEHCFRETYKTR